METRSKRKLASSVQVFSDDFKRMVCEEYLKGNSTKEEIRVRFNIKGSSRLLYWLRKLGYAESNFVSNISIPHMAKSKKETPKNLEKETEDLKLQVEMYKRIFSLAEKEFKISIVKKSGNK